MRMGSFTWPSPESRIELKYDHQAIEWLLANVRGTPVILEASLSYYRSGALRASSYTGLPTVVGFHQNEQRSPSAVAQRERDVHTLYTTSLTERALELIEKYHISYIYVGQLERAEYGERGLAKFERMRGSYLELAYENPKAKIYRVLT
jgi:uncharacterized membrane protein